MAVTVPCGTASAGPGHGAGLSHAGDRHAGPGEHRRDTEPESAAGRLGLGSPPDSNLAIVTHWQPAPARGPTGPATAAAAARVTVTALVTAAEWPGPRPLIGPALWQLAACSESVTVASEEP